MINLATIESWLMENANSVLINGESYLISESDELNTLHFVQCDDACHVYGTLFIDGEQVESIQAQTCEYRGAQGIHITMKDGQGYMILGVVNSYAPLPENLESA